MLTLADLPALLNPDVEPFIPLVLEDPRARHQIRIRRSAGGSRITVSCTCLPRRLIGTRSAWQPGESLAAWRDYHEREAVAGGH